MRSHILQSLSGLLLLGCLVATANAGAAGTGLAPHFTANPVVAAANMQTVKGTCPKAQADNALCVATTFARPRVGTTLTFWKTGKWTGAQPVKVAYRWLRIDIAHSPHVKPIPGAIGPTYEVQRSDIGFCLEGEVIVTNAYGHTAASDSEDLNLCPA